MFSFLFSINYFCPFKDKREIEYLCDNNFTQILGNERNSFIFFKSETCPHCMEFTPTWHVAARIYAHKTKFYIVMHEKCPKMSRYYHVSSFPTLICARYGERYSRCEKRDLHGGLKDCINEKFMEAGKYLDKVNDLIDIIDRNQSFFLVNHRLSQREQYEADHFTPDLQFYSMNSFEALNKIIPNFHPKGSVVFYRASDRQFFDASKNLDSKIIREFLDKNENSTIHHFAVEKVNELFVDQSTLVLIRFDKTSDELDNEDYLYLEDAAKPGKDVIYFTTDNGAVFNDVISPPDDISSPVLSVVHMNGDNPPRWVYIPGERNDVNKPSDFINLVLNGKISTYIKSEDLPEDITSPIHKIVARNFDEEVTKSSKPYVILFYNKETFLVNQLIDKLADAQIEIGDTVKFGFINIAKNETPLKITESMPIIGMYYNGNIIEYYKDRTKIDLSEWIRQVLHSNEL